MSKSEFTVDKEKLQTIQSRVFDAPRELVFKVYTDKELMPKWWGPRQYTTVVQQMDFEVGGKWKFVQKDKEEEYAFHGEYLEIVPNEKITNTFEFEGFAGHVVTETYTFEAVEGDKTRIVAVSQFANIEDLEGMIQSGMEIGARETWERLAEVLPTL